MRLSYNTDEAYTARGWFADDFSVTSGSATALSDDLESGAGLDGHRRHLQRHHGQGWVVNAARAGHPLLPGRVAQLRRLRQGLQYAYTTSYSHEAWKVEKVKYNAPGMLVWYRDSNYTQQLAGQMT